MRWIVLSLIVALAGLSGCQKEESQSTTQPAATPATPAAEPATQPVLPPGHPPLDAMKPKTTQPAGHDAMGASPHGATPAAVKFTAPDNWVSLPKRPMTVSIYGLPRTGSDAEDAQIAVSTLAMIPPWDMNVGRWCAQFELPEGKTCDDIAKQRTLEGTKHPTRLVDITGTYKGQSMSMDHGSGDGGGKTDQRMITAEIQVGGAPWYVKLTGPAATVAHYEEAFLKFVKEAE